MNKSLSSGGSSGIEASLVTGFAAATAVWTAWFVTHSPWLGLPENASLLTLVCIWFAVLAVGVRSASSGWKVGLSGGLISAAIGLLLLGTKLTAAPAETGVTAGLRPNAAVMALGFLVFGGVLGLVAGTVLGSVLGNREQPRQDWLAKFALVSVAAVAPLLFIGGLVTSTNSGMAVPDWPNTYGSNMLLYPLGPRANPGVYLEHSHRLFGTLVGLATLVLMIWVLLAETRRWVKIVAVVAFGLVCLQGALGGLRVLANERALAMVHGVLAQLTFGLLVALAVFLSPGYKSMSRGAIAEGLPPIVRRLRFFSTGLLHSSILQLLLGAAYRHFRDNHSMWSHVAFSFIVLVFGLMSGFAAAAVHGELEGLGPTIRRTGKWLVGVITVQFLLGWATFSMGGRELQPPNPVAAIMRTVHQANGALVLALAVVLFFWVRRLIWAAQPPK